MNNSRKMAFTLRWLCFSVDSVTSENSKGDRRRYLWPRFPQHIIQGNAINVPQSVEYSASLLAELVAGKRMVALLRLHSLLTGKDQPLAIRSHAGAVFSCWSINDRTEVLRFRPLAVLVV